MCGIAGFSGFSSFSSNSQSYLVEMAQAIAHRGPDDQGYFLKAPFALAHRRLSIIDPAGGIQPISNEDQSVCLVANGEIYNFRSLRQELIDQGHIFKSHSDSEVLVHGWEQWGEGMLPRLNGMFAFAIADLRRGVLVLARDRMGKKPLHWFRLGNDIVFASEIKALLKHPQIRTQRALDPNSLVRYLSQEYVHSPYSIFKGIRKLLPGHYLTVDSMGIKETAYWTLESLRSKKCMYASFEDASEHFWEILCRAVSSRLVSDVPLGIFLSGGLDSLAVTIAASATLGESLKSFSIGFTDEAFDESNHAISIARALCVKNNLEYLDQKNMLEVLPKVLKLLDEPMADSSLLPTYLLCRSARKKVTVALSGDGADEQLAGYQIFRAHRIAQFMGKPLGKIINKLGPFFNLWPAKFSDLPLDYLLKGFVKGLGRPAGIRFLTWLGAYNNTALNRLLSPEYKHYLSHKLDPRIELAGDLIDFDSLGDLSLLYLKTYLENDILVKVDRASMFNSLEVRSPFLDSEIVSFLATIPDKWRLGQGFGAKALLKKALSTRVPNEIKPILSRPKKGFSVPIASWLTGPLLEWSRDLLSPGFIQDQGIFNCAEIERIWRNHRDRRVDNRKLLWTLLVFQNWWRLWIKETP